MNDKCDFCNKKKEDCKSKKLLQGAKINGKISRICFECIQKAKKEIDNDK